MSERYNTDSNFETKTKAEFMEWMVGLLLSDDHSPEDTLDEIRHYLADDKDAELKREVLGKVFLKAFESRHSAIPAAKSANVKEMWPRIAEALGMDPDPDRYRAARKPDGVVKPLRRSVWRRASMKVAAVVIPAMVVAGAAWLWIERDRTPAEAPLLANVHVSVPEGGQKRIVLPDGSQVWVNSSTTLSYNDDFSKKRIVTLDGEAFFSVVRDTLAPFHVKATDMVIEVLGTEFNVKNRASDSILEVVLATGSVKVETPRNKAIELTPGKRLTFHTVSSQATIDDIAAEMVSAWRIMDLHMVEKPLMEALERIASYHGRDLSITGTLPDGDLVNFVHDGELSIEQVLDVVRTITGNFNYHITEHEIVIRPLSMQKE